MLYHKFDRTYLRGWFVRGETRMYVNRGLGTSHIPLRVGSRPEITVLDFVGDAS
jgi:predicted MPP superfamily phosphohydrolase